MKTVDSEIEEKCHPKHIKIPIRSKFIPLQRKTLYNPDIIQPIIQAIIQTKHIFGQINSLLIPLQVIDGNSNVESFIGDPIKQRIIR